tara:strand:+ start:9072 stop:10217 length:1146 start_codon:yes stop_codon:yes gene_type:complete
MKNKYFVIGGGPLQFDFIKTLKKMNFETYVFDSNKNCKGSKIADKFFNISISNKEKILKVARKEKPISIHTVATEQGNITACYIAEKLKLHCNSFETSKNTTNKYRMKIICAKYRILTPSFKLYSKKRKLIEIDKFPKIIKPNISSAGRGVKLINNLTELKNQINISLKYSSDNNFLIEDYIDGDQYSVESISANNSHRIIAITKMSFSNGDDFVENNHYLPALINKDLEKKIKKFTTKVLKSFNIKYGASHIEIRIKNKKIYLIEIASRMGGWRNWMIKNAFDIDYLELIILSTLNLKIKIKKNHLNKFSIAKTISNLEDYKYYKYFKKNHPDMIFLDLYDKRKKIKKAENLIQSNGPYLISCNKKILKNIMNNKKIIKN